MIVPVIARIAAALGLLPTPVQPASPAERITRDEAAHAARTLNARRRALRRQATAHHIANFGPFARGLDILKEGPAND